MPAHALGHETAWGDRLETIRQRRGETVVGFAESLGISRGQLRGWISQLTEPRLNAALAVCHVLGHTLDELAHPLTPLPDEAGDVPKATERFGATLAVALKDRGIAGAQLADAIGVKRATVYDWLALKKAPRLSAVLVVAQHLGLSMHELAVGPGPRE